MAILTFRSKVVQLLLIAFGLLSVAIWYRSFREHYNLKTYSHGSYAMLKSIVLGEIRWAKHTIRKDGLLEVNMTGRHPLWELIEDAERRWDELHAKFVIVLQDKALLIVLISLKAKQDTSRCCS
jgi:hypothetical protein